MSKKKNKQRSPLGKLTSLPTTALAFVKEARDELKKVTWPTRQTTIRYTLIVIIASIIVGLVIGGIDYLFQLGLESII
jgi:preprotein translocase subunit SecE